MVEEFMKGVEESRETANARALASFSATGADGSVIAYGSKVALEQDPDNYDHDLGVEICKKRIEDELWKLEGYRKVCERAVRDGEQG